MASGRRSRSSWSRSCSASPSSTSVRWSGSERCSEHPGGARPEEALPAEAVPAPSRREHPRAARLRRDGLPGVLDGVDSVQAGLRHPDLHAEVHPVLPDARQLRGRDSPAVLLAGRPQQPDRGRGGHRLLAAPRLPRSARAREVPLLRPTRVHRPDDRRADDPAERAHHPALHPAQPRAPGRQAERPDRHLPDLRAAVLRLDPARVHDQRASRARGGGDGRRLDPFRGVRPDPATTRCAGAGGDLDLRVHPGLERVHHGLHPPEQPGEADADRVAGPVHEPARHPVGPAHGQRDADRDSRRRVLRRRPPAHRLRAHGRRGSRMSGELARDAAGCLLASFAGHRAPDWVRRWVERGLGGVVLFSGNVQDGDQVAALTSVLRAERPELVVATDEEGGDVTRLEARSGSSYPGNLALGSIDDVELTRAVAGAIADDLHAAGVTLNLAPVADVNSNPQNPVIGVRSFGSDPELVARHVAAFVRGTQERGVAACAKHFPGHGDTAVDSHLELPVVEGGRGELLAGPLLPFRAAIEAGAGAVMTAHVVVRGVDEAPATLSRVLVTDLLRGELGFEGAVVSDALEMRAISGTVGFEDGAVRAIAAGVDALCLGHDVDEVLVERVHGALVAAAGSGRSPPERLAEAADAVARLSRFSSRARSTGASEGEIGATAARRAVRARGNVALAGSPLVVELAPEPMIAAGPAEHGLANEIGARRPGSAVVTVYEAPENGGRLIHSAEGRPLVIILRDAGRHRWQQSVASELVEQRPDAVVVETGLPGWIPQGATAFVETYGSARVNLETAADLLLPR